MAFQIEDGTGSGMKVQVTDEHQLVAKAITEPRVAYVAINDEQSFVVTVEDAGPSAGEYTLYVKNTSEHPFVVDIIRTNNVDADVIWKLHKVTGTAGGASALTPVNTNLASGKTADLTARGGAGGVTGLTSSEVMYEWFGGGAYNSTKVVFDSTVVLGQDDAIALEFDAGTGGAVAINVHGHFHAD